MGAIAHRVGKLTEGWGRRAAFGVLIVVLALQTGAGGIFHAPRLALFDFYERTAPRRLGDATPVVIVAIDDASLAAIGQWPWPRQIDAQLITKILAGHPAAVGVDMIWSEPDRQSPEEWLKQANGLAPSLGESIRSLPSHDSLLRDALASGPVVIGLIGTRDNTGQTDTGKLAPFRRIGAVQDLPSGLPDFTTAIRTLPGIDRAAAGHGLLSVDADSDNVFRRLPTVAMISNRLAPSFSLETLRVVAKAPVFDLYLSKHGVQHVKAGPVDIPTDADGGVWVDFTPHDPRRFVSAADILSGKTNTDVFDKEVVLIGTTGLGQTDQRMTPLGLMPGTEVHAQLLENILGNVLAGTPLARRPNWTTIAEPTLTLLLGLVLIAALPAVRPRWQAPLMIVPLALLAAAGFGLWREARLLVDVATPAIGQLSLFVALIGGEFAEADAQRRRLRRELEVRKLAAAKAEGELEAGRRIQMGILPTADSVAKDHRFDLSALMIPARQIGGDLYDFFKIDDDRLFLAVGDVSGKGVPAALFMALGKSLCKSAALRGETDIGAIVNRANAEISRDNPEMLFITMFAGILDVATGVLSFCNAGHDPPYLLRHGEAPYSLDTVGGPPLCVMDEFVYETETCRLLPGDILCVTTDGVGEAMTAAGELMGRERVEATLADLPPDADAKTVAGRLHEAVDTFVAGAEASDDLTILTVRWNGAT